jgi:putative transposase
MGAEPRYKTNAGAVFSLKYHLVWRPKYRRKVLVSPIDDRLKELIAETAEQHGMTVYSIEVMPDHVHLFVEADPSLCVAEIVNRFRFKSHSSRILRHEFAPLRSRLPTLWSHSYYAVSETVVRRYIEAQKRV